MAGYISPLFTDDSSGAELYHYSQFDTVRDLVKEFLFDYPQNKVRCSYFKSLVEDSDIAGICCAAYSENDVLLLDDLLGYIDIPASMSGLVCDIVRKSSKMAYLMIYNQNNINPESVKALRIISNGLGKIF